MDGPRANARLQRKQPQPPVTRLFANLLLLFCLAFFPSQTEAILQ